MSQLAAPNETVKLLAELIANQCVNDGSPDSGQEVRNADVLGAVLEGPGELNMKGVAQGMVRNLP